MKFVSQFFVRRLVRSIRAILRRILPVACLVAGLGFKDATDAPKEPPLVLPTLVVIGFRIPTSWLEVSWECNGPLPYNKVKRAWLSKVGHGTPAEKVGMKVGDRLLAIGSEPVESMSGERLRSILEFERDPGSKERFAIQTPGTEKRIVVIQFDVAPGSVKVR